MLYKDRQEVSVMSLKDLFPKRMLWGDKVFFSIVIICFLALFWLRFLEQYLSVWFSLLVSGPITVYIFLLENPVSIRKREQEKVLKQYMADEQANTNN